MKTILLSVFLVAFCSITAQDFKSIDSLKAILEQTKSIKEQINLNIKIASKYNTFNEKKAYKYANKAVVLSEQNNLESLKHQALIDMARYYENYRSNKKADSIYQLVLHYAKKTNNDSILSRTQNNYAHFLGKTGDYDRSIAFYTSVLESKHALLDQEYIALDGLSGLYLSQRNFKKAYEYADKAKHIAEQLNNKRDLAHALSKVAKSAMILGKYDEAETYLKKIISLAKETGAKKEEAYAYGDLSQLYTRAKKDSITGLLYIEKAYKIANDINDIRLLRGVRMVLGDTYIKTNQKEKGYNVLVENYKDTYTNHRLRYALQTANALVVHFEKENQPDSALVWRKKYELIKDSLLTIDKLKAFKEIETKYEVSLKDKTISELEEDKSSLNNWVNRLWPFMIILIITLIVIGWLYKRSKNKSRHLEEAQVISSEKIDMLKRNVTKDYIILKDKTKVYLEDLIYLKSSDHYLEVHQQNKKSHLVRGKLSEILKELPPNFMRCHRSYIVNSNCIKRVNTSHIILLNNKELPMSKSYKDQF